jgi:aldo/keto reductase family protein
MECHGATASDAAAGSRVGLDRISRSRPQRNRAASLVAAGERLPERKIRQEEHRGPTMASPVPPHRKPIVWRDRNWAILDVLRKIAHELGATPSQVALSWVGNRPAVTSTIIGARTMVQFVENLAAAELHLAAETVARLDAAARLRPTTTRWAFRVLQRSRYIDSSERHYARCPIRLPMSLNVIARTHWPHP